eukprot:tig00000158_g10117.t1
MSATSRSIRPPKPSLQLRGEPLDSKPRTFPARPDVVRANVARAAGGRQASCIQAFEPVWLREKRLAFWQETASCPLTRFIITHCVVDPTTFLVGSETEGWMTSVAGIVEYIARTEGPDTSAAVGADIENGRLDETLAGFGSSCRPYSYKLGGVWQTYIRGIFKDPVADVGPFLVKPHTKGKGKRTRNSAPAFLPPSPPPRPPAAPRPAAHRRDAAAPGYPDERRRGPERLRELGLLRERRRPQPLPGPGAVLTAIQASGPSRRPSGGRWRRARRARRRSGARPSGQRLQATIAFRAELDSGFRAARSPGRRPRSAGGRSSGVGGAGEGPRLQLPARARAQGLRVGRGAGGLAGGDRRGGGAGGARGGEDNARFRHLHH